MNHSRTHTTTLAISLVSVCFFNTFRVSFSANFLAQMIECEDFGDLNIADFMVQSASAFEKVFQNESQLKVRLIMNFCC